MDDKREIIVSQDGELQQILDEELPPEANKLEEKLNKPKKKRPRSRKEAATEDLDLLDYSPPTFSQKRAKTDDSESEF